MITALLVVGILVLLIVTHELGHFVAAKIFGVRVDEFGVGYPPRALSLGTWGGTEYTLNWIPFGGFVRLYGEEADAHGKGSLLDAARWKQVIILVAGVAVNALVAWILFAAALHAGIPRVIEGSFAADSSARLMVSEVLPGSPAAAAGITTGDRIVGLRDQDGVNLTDLSPDAVSHFVSLHGGKRLSIMYLHGATSSTSIATVIPANAVIPGSAAKPALGVGLVGVSDVALPWSRAFSVGLTNTYEAFITVAGSLLQLVSGIFHGTANLADVVGPIGLAGVVGSAAHEGVGTVLALAAFIGVNLAIINLLPIPVLDGGRLVIVVLEGLTRRRAPHLLIQVLNTISIALIIIIMLTVTYHDLARLFT
jgi:regulator of sigma E protease